MFFILLLVGMLALFFAYRNAKNNTIGTAAICIFIGMLFIALAMSYAE